jgi:hypothetical protein
MSADQVSFLTKYKYLGHHDIAAFQIGKVVDIHKKLSPKNTHRIYLFGFILLLSIMSACTADPCVSLCEETTQQLGMCLQEWPATWSDVGAQSRQDFSDTCSDLWSVERSTLEPRALDDAYEQCEESVEYLSENTQQCDQLRALYLLPASY